MNQLSATDEDKETIRDFIEEKNYPALNDFLDTFGDNSITKALKMLPRLFGGEEVFDKAAKLFSDEKTDAILASLKELFKDIEKLGLKGRVTVDLGMVNKTDYYTGVILKGYMEGYGEPVISGGRYDKLIAEFGYDVPATGFAVNVDAVAKIRLRNEKIAVREVEAIVFCEKGYEMKAVLHARELRAKGMKVELAAFNDIEKVRKYAAEVKIEKIISVGETIKEI
jgi:ATP phosphoribosyltransferase regulatory subunit